MKIDRVMLSLTSDPLYAEGLEVVRKAWQKLGVSVTVVWIGNRWGMNDLRVKSVEGIPDGNLAKLMRVIATENHPDDWCLIADADMLPLDLEYFAQGSSYASEDSILYYTSELTGEDAGKFPACYMLAKGKTFTKYVNPLGLRHEQLIKCWNYSRLGNPMEQPFSDESVYAQLFITAPKITLERYHQDHRLCRSAWPNKEELELNLANGAYIDCHMPRPFSENMDKLEPVLKAIGVYG